MGNKVRPKMSPADRAKQFMPFDAVKGLREALRKKEAELLKDDSRVKLPEIEYSEEDFYDFSRKM